MAWTNIPDDVLEPGKPIRSVDAIALRDNPIALAQGLPGAPRIWLQAIQPLSAGDIVQSQLLTTVGNDSTGHSTHAIWGFIQSGFIRVTLEHRSSHASSSVDASVVRIRNGVLTVLQSWSTQSTSFVFRSVDVSISPGDIIATQHNSSNSATTSFLRNSRILSNGEAWWPSPTNINFGEA